MLASGELTPGKRLVNRALADKIGVSVIPVREAIRRLASEGLIDHIPGAGAFVKTLSRRDLDNLYVLRDALESCAAAEAARNITEHQIKEIERSLDCARKIVVQIRQQPEGYGTMEQLDRWLDNEQKFHHLLVEASRNELLAKVIADNRAIGSIFEAQRSDPRLLAVDVAEETCESKAKLIHALRDHDADLARKLMSAQIQRGRSVVLGFYQSGHKPWG